MAGFGVRGFDDIELEAALAAVEAHAITLAGGIGGEVVGEHGAVAVAHHDAHVVLDGDNVAKDVLVAPITVGRLALVVERAHLLVFGEIEGKGVAAGGGIAGAAHVGAGFAASLGIFAAGGGEEGLRHGRPLPRA